MTQIDLLPTGTCFDDVADMIMDMARRGEITKDDFTNHSPWPKIVHGICTAPDGVFSHAWVETEKHVFETRVMNGGKVQIEYPKDAYYEKMGVIRSIPYTLMEAYDMERKMGHPGPWDAEMRSLCKDYDPMADLKPCQTHQNDLDSIFAHPIGPLPSSDSSRSLKASLKRS